MEDCQAPLHPRAIEGLELFNAHKYWHAHEALEAAWKEERGPVRELYRGILQAAVVYLHASRGNYAGAVKVHQRCIRWLEPWPAVCRGVKVGMLREDLDALMQEVKRLGPDNLKNLDIFWFKPVDYTKA